MPHSWFVRVGSYDPAPKHLLLLSASSASLCYLSLPRFSPTTKTAQPKSRRPILHFLYFLYFLFFLYFRLTSYISPNPRPTTPPDNSSTAHSYSAPPAPLSLSNSSTLSHPQRSGSPSAAPAP